MTMRTGGSTMPPPERPAAEPDGLDFADLRVVLALLRQPTEVGDRMRADLLRVAAAWLDPAAGPPPLRAAGLALAGLAYRGAAPAGADSTVPQAEAPPQVDGPERATGPRAVAGHLVHASGPGSGFGGRLPSLAPPGTAGRGQDSGPLSHRPLPGRVAVVPDEAAMAARAARLDRLRRAAHRLAGHPELTAGLPPAARREGQVPVTDDPEQLDQWITLGLLALPAKAAVAEHAQLRAELAAAGPPARHRVGGPAGESLALDRLGLGVPMPEVSEALGEKAERLTPLAVAVSDLLRLAGLPGPPELVRCALWRDDRPLANPQVHTELEEELFRRLGALGRSGPAGSEAEAHALWRVHEAVASVYPWPLPAVDSWWDRTVGVARWTLDTAVAAVPPEARPVVGLVLPGPEMAGPPRHRDDDVLVIDHAHPGWILRELRAPFRSADGSLDMPGRVLRTTASRG